MRIVKSMAQTSRRCAALVLLSLGLPHALHATSVLQVNIQQLLNDAAVIFEGEVIASDARWNTDNTYITTWVTFMVADVLKGELPSTTITQSFAGGTVGDTTLEVSGMVYPQLGETGIYFIENPDRQQVNPMVGWSQGHFKIKKDSYGKERVLTESDNPIQGLEDAHASNKQRKSAQGESDLPLSKGAAEGLRVGKSRDALDTAIDKEDFKKALRMRLSIIAAAKEEKQQAEKSE